MLEMLQSTLTQTAPLFILLPLPVQIKLCKVEPKETTNNGAAATNSKQVNTDRARDGGDTTKAKKVSKFHALT